MKKESNTMYWLVVIAGCGLIGSCLGLGVNVSGLFFNSIAEEFNVGRGSVAAGLTVYNLVHAFAGMLAAKVMMKFGFKKTAVAGTIIQVASTFLLSLSPAVWFMWVLNALRGFASGMIGTVAVTITLNYWFNKNNALVTSLAMGFSGLAGAVLSPILASIISSAGWRTGYIVLAGINLLFNLPAILFPITLKPEMKGLEPFGGQKDTVNGNTGENVGKVSVVLVIMVMLYSACAAGAAALPSHFPGIADSYGLAAFGALMVSACMVTNTGGKVLMGTLIDRIGAKLSVSIYAAIIMLSAAALAFGRSEFILVAAAGGYGLCYSMGTVGSAMLTREMFGTGLYSTVYPKVALATTVSNAIFTTVVGTMYDISGTYTGIILFMIVMIAISYLMMNLAYQKKNQLSAG